MAVGDTAYHTMHFRDFHRVLERQDAQEKAHFAVACFWRAGARTRPAGLRVLLLRTTDGGRRSGRVPAFVTDWWLDDHVHGSVHVHLGYDHG